MPFPARISLFFRTGQARYLKFAFAVSRRLHFVLSTPSSSRLSRRNLHWFIPLPQRSMYSPYFSRYLNVLCIPLISPATSTFYVFPLFLPFRCAVFCGCAALGRTFVVLEVDGDERSHNRVQLPS